MPESPALEMQGYIVQALKDDPTVQALCGSRVYDDVPPSATFPYISMGPATEVTDNPECIDAIEINIQLDAWSRSVGFPEVKRIASAVHTALHDVEVDLPVNACTSLYHANTLYMRDPDGLTSHAVIQLQAYVERRP
jgi:hypothetical protein